MKKYLSTMAAFFGFAIMSFSQSNFIATLQHNGNFSDYYGATALVSAYNAAANGDIITLSSGTFSYSGTFNKGITLRGNGIGAEKKTFISGDITFSSTDSTSVTSVEGIVFEKEIVIKNDASGKGQGIIHFIKDRFNDGTKADVSDTYSENKGPSTRFYNCIILNSTIFMKNSYPDFIYYNSYIKENGIRYVYNNHIEKETTSAFVNCVIDNSKVDFMEYLNFYNCIFFLSSRIWTGFIYHTLPSSSICYNCLSIILDSNYFNMFGYGENNWYTQQSLDKFFTTFDGSNYLDDLFELTEFGKKLLGTDGTQIGMQGGYYPYTKTVQYPIITKIVASPQTTKEGILNLEIEVDGN